MAVTRETLRLQAEIRRDLARITNRQTRDLISAWADAWDEVQPDLVATLLDMLTSGDRVTRTQLLRSTRLRRALDVVRRQLEALAEQAGVQIVGDLQAVVDAAGAAQASVVDSQLPAGTDLVGLDSWSRVDDRQIAAIVRRSTEQITALTQPLTGAAYDAVRRELIRGVAAGSNPRNTAARMVRRAEKRFNGGLTRALNIARTETLDAHRAAADLGQRPHADVLAGWTWLATLDKRTCPSCLAQHGTVHRLDEPGPLDHQQGRCARMPTTRSWADLGFNIAEPPSLVPDAGDWFEGQSPEVQLEILGPSRWQAWVHGDYPMDAWSRRVSAAGWRDSYRVSPAPSNGGRRSVGFAA